MYYNQSLQILERIKSAKNILVNIHKNPDLDSIGSASGLYQLINQLNKKVTLLASEKIENSLLIFPETKKIKIIEYSFFDFSSYDLFLIVDSSSYDRVTGSKKVFLPKIPTIVIDHHHFNSIKGEIKLVDTEAAATCEIIYKLFNDWKIKLNKTIATRLYSGIVGDTVFFKYLADPEKTFSIAQQLLKKGADHQLIVNRVYDSLDFKFVKLMGLFLKQMKIEKTRSGKKFVWSAIGCQEFFSFGHPKGVREAAADSFFRSIKGVDFGLAMIEGEKGKINISFRSKSVSSTRDKCVDVAKIAKSFGGGGHINAAGATVEGEFNRTVKNVISQIVAIT